jgi:hypothetical protein
MIRDERNIARRGLALEGNEAWVADPNGGGAT